MQRVSVRTLVLMVLLLGYVLAHQCLDATAMAGTEAVWLSSDLNDPNDPPELANWEETLSMGCPDDPNDPNDSPPE